jgi:hypothetical protein
MSFPDLVGVVWEKKRHVYESLQKGATPIVESFLADLKK